MRPRKAQVEISGAETDENGAWCHEKVHLLFTDAGTAKKQSHTETRTKPEQVPNNFRPSSAEKIAKKRQNEENPNETRTSPEQVPNKFGLLKHCNRTTVGGSALKYDCEGLWISQEQNRAQSIDFPWKDRKNHSNNVFPEQMFGLVCFSAKNL